MDKKLQTFNLDYLNEIASGDVNFKNDLIKIFLQQIPEFIANMKKFFDEKNWENLAKEAHTAKSSVLIFGMEETGANLKKIQLLTEDNDVEKIPELLNIVLTEMEKIQNPLKEIMNS